MSYEEEERRPVTATGLTRELRTLSVDDLERYVRELEGEIRRVQGEIQKRRDVRGAADALFRRPAGASDA